LFTCYYKASRLLYSLLCLPANISAEPFNMVTHKIQCDASYIPPLDGVNSDDDMPLGGASRKSGQSVFSNYSSLQTVMSRSKSQEVSVFIGVDNCWVFVHPGAKHNHRQYICWKSKGKCIPKGHQAYQKIAKEVGKSGYYQPATSRNVQVRFSAATPTLLCPRPRLASWRNRQESLTVRRPLELLPAGVP
jgi:hypothetical protein